MAHSIDEFNRQAAKLTQAVQSLQAQQYQQTKELNNAYPDNIAKLTVPILSYLQINQPELFQNVQLRESAVKLPVPTVPCNAIF